MSRALNNLRSLHNPLCLSGIGGLAVVRGAAFICTGTGWLPLEGYNGAPHLPCEWVITLGLAWVFAGSFLWLSLVIRRLFIIASALMVGMYAAWSIVHTADLFISPDWDGIVGLSVYAMMVPVILTLAAIEINPRQSRARGGGQ